jgi:hypothetical protein
MDQVDPVESYQRKAEECLAMALKASDEDHVRQSVQMALYWFDQAEAAASFFRPAPESMARHSKTPLKR